VNDLKNVIKAFHDGGTTSYIVKPISKKNLTGEMVKLGLLE
jgi:hypothetical protein